MGNDAYYGIEINKAKNWNGNLVNFANHGIGHNWNYFKKFLEEHEGYIRCPVCFCAMISLAGSSVNTNFRKEAIRVVLRHSMSSETDYLFAFLKEYHYENSCYEREYLVAKFATDYVYVQNEGFPLTKEARKFYCQKIFEWFIRRYAWGKAFKANWWHGLRGSNWVSLFYPRLLGGLFIGFLPLVTQRDLWGLASRFDFSSSCVPPATIVVISVILLFVFLYVFYECFEIAGKRGPAIIRSLITSMYGIVCSVLMFRWAIWPLMRGEDEFVKSLSPWTYAPFFCSLALLIGILLQFFWEDKTITEPL